MFRSEAMTRLTSLVRVATLCERRGIAPSDAVGLAREAQERAWSRREFLRASAGVAAAVGFGLGRTVAAPVRGSPRIAIVGAGLAGLVCADTLRRHGLRSAVYEAHATRVGGRCYSLRGLATGKVAEKGGEFIDTTHKTMRAYANEFNLAREDVGRAPGEVAYFFGGQRYTDEQETMIAFRGKPWLTGSGSNGSAYTDLTNVQTTWETSPITAGAVSILTDYAGGNRGRTLAQESVQQRVAPFVAELERVYPGVSEAAVRSAGQFVAHREHWPSNPLTRGAYTCYLPGQFTSVAGLEGQAAGRLKFAGEHADSFYSSQGFMEGACLSGIRAAEEIVADVRAGVLR